MAEILLNGMETGGPGNPDTLELDKYPMGHLCMALNLRFTIPVVGVGNFTGNASDLQDVMLMAIGALTLRDGVGHVPYPTVPGDELRTVHRFANLNEVPNDIVGVAFVNGNAYNVHFDLRLRFGIPWMARPESRLPGPSQMRKCELEIVEGSTVPARFTRGGGNITIDVDVQTMESNVDQYAPMISYFRDNQSRLYASSPDGGVIAAWDGNDPFSSTAIDLFSVSVGSEDKQLRRPYMVTDAFRDGVLQGSGADISDTVTPLYVCGRNTDPDRMKHGRLTVFLATQYVSTIQLRGLYWPTVTPDAAAAATLHSAEEHNTGVLGSVVDAAVPQADPGSASTRPIRFFPANLPEFTLRPGIIGQPGATSVQTSIPPTFRAAVKATVDQHAKVGTSTGNAAKAGAAIQLGSILPGFTSSNGGKAGGVLGLLGF